MRPDDTPFPSLLTSRALIELPEDIYKLLRDMIRNYCGIYFDDQSKYFLEGRLQDRLHRLQLNNFKDYYYFLKYDRLGPDEFGQMIDLLTIQETYFFREDRQLRAFSDEILPEISNARADTQSLRIWSAGCATGEEAYTVAMLILENHALEDWNIEVFATDISQKALKNARRGYYANSSLRNLIPYYRSKYFHPEEQGYRIDDRVKKKVSFLHLNLLDQDKMALMNNLDVIFCRNVLIYFDSEAKKKIFELFYQKLKPGGYLLLGHSESLMNISTAFALRHLKNDLVYHKK